MSKRSRRIAREVEARTPTVTSAAKAERTEAEAWRARREWVSRNRWYIGGAGLIATAAILWPRTSTATVVPAPAPTQVPLTPAEIAQFQRSQQSSLGMQIAVGAAAVVAAGVIYVATSDSKEYRPTTRHVPAYRFIAPSTIVTPTRGVWSSWVSDW